MTIFQVLYLGLLFFGRRDRAPVVVLEALAEAGGFVQYGVVRLVFLLDELA